MADVTFELDEQVLRDAAYYLWEADGRPDGRDQDYWFKAIEAERSRLKSDLAGPSDEAVDRAVEIARRIGLQRGFKRPDDDAVSGGFNQKAKASKAADAATQTHDGSQQDENIDDLGPPFGRNNAGPAGRSAGKATLTQLSSATPRAIVCDWRRV